MVFYLQLIISEVHLRWHESSDAACRLCVFIETENVKFRQRHAQR